MLSFAFLLIQPVHGETYRVLHRFRGGAGGAYPSSPVVYDGEGNFYGATGGGGASDFGTVFKVSKEGKFSVLYRFLGGTDGFGPLGGLVVDGNGILYGTTAKGGFLGKRCRNYSGCGTVFKLDKAGKHTIIHNFTGDPDGAVPETGLIQDAQGNLYGTTYYEGEGRNCKEMPQGHGCGTVFKVDTNGQETVLYSFTGNRDGEFPSYLIRDADGTFYGTASAGGDFKNACGPLGCGTVYSLSRRGKITVLHIFHGTDGASPHGLVRDTEGNLFGATPYNFGRCECGLLFKVDMSGKFSVLYRLTGGADGLEPNPGVILDAKGNLFGTTEGGGFSGNSFCKHAIGCGVVFEFDNTGKYTVLHRFTGGTDGANPVWGLSLQTGENLYSTTSQTLNKSYKCCRGTVFTIDQAADYDSYGLVP